MCHPAQARLHGQEAVLRAAQTADAEAAAEAVAAEAAAQIEFKESGV